MLNNQQLEIFNHDYLNNSSAVCIIAGAGSGKTTTIIEKIIKMINDGSNPENFFITTFSRNASKQLKFKLGKKLDKDTVDSMTIGTFHAIAFKNLDIKNNLAQSFDKMLYDYLNFIKVNNTRYRYIFIDEYQDIDPIQEEIINTLYNKYDNNKLLMVIGDDQQNIYTFRGTDIKFILNFKEKYNGIIYKLETNYRCFPAIVEVSNYILSYNINKIEKTFIANKINKNKINLKLFDKTDIMIDYLVNIISLLNNKVNLSKYAIISRYKKQLNKIENRLAKLNIATLYLENNFDNMDFQNNSNNYKNRLILTTIHGTKGLEYHNVILLDYHFLNKSNIEEERRLYYVAITRAIDNLMIIY